MPRFLNCRKIGRHSVADSISAVSVISISRRSGGKPEGPIDLAYCTSVKARGIRIAVLYTEYLPESATGSWSETNVKAPYLSPTDKISPAMQSCASPGLYYKVTTDGDISKAMADLFRQVVATAHLVN